MPLLERARRYPGMKIVMIHCWPFLKEAGWLAKYQANMYIDTCWQPILNPDFLREAMNTWLQYVPFHKITCGHDATTVEMAAGSALFTREILGDVLGRVGLKLGISEGGMRQVGADFLYNNAVQIYGIGKRFVV
jgi:predicted TIM-barrel fold metal-dependent hydrolase